jgi:LacI family transcriptional regulator
MEYVSVLIQRRVDGVLLVPAADTSDSTELLVRHGLPVVVLDRRPSSSEVDAVRSDSEGGAYLAVRHLVELGHRRIAVLTGPESVSTSADRVAGYRRALAEAGIGPELQTIMFGEYNEASGYAMTTSLLSAAEISTAIFAGNNFIAFGALQRLREAGLEVPRDMSVVVFDDLPQGWILPFLTVISQPAYEIGKQACELMLTRLASSEPLEPRTVVLPSNLIVRQSSAPPRSTLAQPAPAGAPTTETAA